MTLVKRAGKPTGIYPNAWNLNIQDDIKSLDFDRKQWIVQRIKVIMVMVFETQSKTYQDYQ